VAGLDLVTPASAALIDAAVAKQQHIRVDGSDEDAVIDAYLAAAQGHVETFLRASLIETVWRYRLDGGFPREIRLPIGPVLTTTGLEVRYVDDAGVEQVLDSSVYQVSLGETGIIRAAFSQVWPAVRPQMDAVKITFRAGWPAAEQVPAAIKAAVLLVLGDLYENREASIAGSMTELPTGAKNLLMPYVRHD